MSEAVAGESNRELLDRYRRQWGMPTDFVQVAQQHGRGFRVLLFEGSDPVARFVTLGLGTCPAANGTLLHTELLLALATGELAAIGASKVTAFVADVAAHLLAHSIRPIEGSVIPAATLAPWDPDAILFDVPRGEPPELAQFDADGHPVRLAWAVPIYASEAELVTRQGLGAFDLLVEISTCSLVDVRRAPLR